METKTTTMTQLTSHIAIFLFNMRSPQVTLHSIPGIRTGLSMDFPHPHC